MWSGSPTFVLVQEYLGALPVYHIDAYRLKDVDEFVDLGGEDYLWGDGVCIVEWAERIDEALDGDVLRMRIDVISENSRRVEMSPGGPRSTILLAAISHAVAKD
jgi:tRNA threonylcarbamoyladenosine biosynthesis protein TsaE